MITVFRRLLETWVARGFFLIMVLAFVSWGVGDVIRLIGTSTWVAKVGGQTIEGMQLQEAYQRDMAQVTRNLPSGQEPTQDMRNGVARDTLQRLITQAALSQELQRLHVVSPDPAVRQTVLSMLTFRGPNGQFDRQTFEAVLRNNGLNEPRFLDMARGELAQRQLLGAVSAGAATPETLLRPLYQGQFEKRSADMVEFPLAAAPRPHRPRPSCSAGTTIILINIPRRNTAGSRPSCCHRRHWRRISRSAMPTSGQPTSSARRST
jgi:peptidyl-prolyl cis-trans isomerase D